MAQSKCSVCGATFEQCRINHFTCSPACSRLRKIEMLRKKYKPHRRHCMPLEPWPTKLTRYSLSLWHREGMSVNELAMLISRSPEEVQQVLDEEMQSGRYEKYRSNFKPLGMDYGTGMSYRDEQI